MWWWSVGFGLEPGLESPRCWVSLASYLTAPSLSFFIFEISVSVKVVKVTTEEFEEGKSPGGQE